MRAGLVNECWIRGCANKIMAELQLLSSHRCRCLCFCRCRCRCLCLFQTTIVSNLSKVAIFVPELENLHCWTFTQRVHQSKRVQLKHQHWNMWWGVIVGWMDGYRWSVQSSVHLSFNGLVFVWITSKATSNLRLTMISLILRLSSRVHQDFHDSTLSQLSLNRIRIRIRIRNSPWVGKVDTFLWKAPDVSPLANKLTDCIGSVGLCAAHILPNLKEKWWEWRYYDSERHVTGVFTENLPDWWAAALAHKGKVLPTEQKLRWIQLLQNSEVPL